MKTYLDDGVECVRVGIAFDETTDKAISKLLSLSSHVYKNNWKVLNYPSICDQDTHEIRKKFEDEFPEYFLNSYIKGIFRFCVPLDQLANFMEWRKTQNYKNPEGPFRPGESEELDALFKKLRMWTRVVEVV